MSHYPEIVLSEITAEKYQSLLATAKSLGLDLSGETGSTNYQRYGFHLDLRLGWLMPHHPVRTKAKPIFFPCNMIESRLRSPIS